MKSHKLADAGLAPGKHFLSHPSAVLTLTIGVALTLSLFFQTQRFERRAAEARLRQTTSDVRHFVQSGITNKLSSLSALRSFFAASRQVERAEFRIYSETLLRRFTEIEAFEWIPRVMPDDLEGYRAELVGTLGIDPPVIFRRDPDGRRAAIVPANEYYPVIFAEPLEPNLTAIGYDQSTDPERLRAMQRSREADDIVATRIIRIHRDGNRPEEGHFKGFIAFSPVFKSDATVRHAPKPPQILTGYVAAVFRAEELVKALLSFTAKSVASVRVQAQGSRLTGMETLFEKGARTPSGLEHMEKFEIAGCRWTVSCSVPFEPLGPDRRASAAVLVTGLLLSALISAVLVSIERKKMHELTAELSMRDELTGLYNRRGFMLLAEGQMRLAKRNQAGFWLLALDLDGLKRVNDTRGHAEGDRLIARSAEILRSTLRDSDIIARLGGDEFAALVIESKPDAGSVIVENIRAKARAEAGGRPGLDPALFSVGVVYVVPETEVGLDAWMELADRAMYQNKAVRKRTGDRS